MSGPVRIGLLGFGHIGGALARAAAAVPGQASIVAALVASPRKPRAAGAPPLVADVAGLLAARPDIVVECAGREALRAHGAAVLESGRDLVPASMGLFADEAAAELLRAAARRGGARLRMPSGAVAGIDALLGARRLGLDSVRYRFVMAPAAWGHGGEGVVYRGNAREAARNYPKHANVTATIALAGAGFERTEVELVVDPASTDNRHEIEAAGDFGRFSIAVTGRRISPDAPSSRLVAGSLLAAALDGAPHLF